MELINNRKSQYKICIPNESSECIVFAAQELQHFLLQCTDVKLDVDKEKNVTSEYIISLGNTEKYKQVYPLLSVKELTSDGFVIKTHGNGIFINAATDRGVLYGVYEFLERFLGVRFISSDTTVLPHADSLEIGEVDTVNVPDFPLRGYLEASMFHGYEDADFAARKRANHTFLQLDDKHGGRCPIWGRNDSHNFHFYVQPEIYNNPNDKENYHPEFFYDEGAGMKCTDGGFIATNEITVCLTNGITEDGKLDESMDISVIKIAIEELKKDIIANPDIVYFTFEQEDGDIRCQCPKCLEAEKKYKRSGMLIRFCNVLATELQKWSDSQLDGRPINIVTFGYSYTAEPPVEEKDGEFIPLDETVKPCKNLMMRLALGRNDCYSYFDERQWEVTRTNLKKWKALGDTFFAWIYDAFFDRYLLFMPSLHTIQDNVVGFKEYGIQYLMINGAYNSHGLWQDIMKAYIYQAAMWDTTRDTAALQEEFLYHYFGETGKKYVDKFITAMYDFYFEKIKTDDRIYFHSFGAKWEDVFPKDLLLDMLQLIRNARAEVAKTEKDEAKAKLYDKHLAQVELSPIFPLCEHYKYYFPEKSEEEYLQFAKEFVALCEYAGVTSYHELIEVSTFPEENYKFPY